ncbi:MAG TPA: PIN domain-containing protein [Streptosporangiaceae bacterium]
MVRSEAESADLVHWLNAHENAPLVSSALIEVEVPRALRRSAPQALVGVPSALARIYRVEIDATIRATAATYADHALRTLDAVHLATAQVLAGGTGAEVEAFVSYDKRLLLAATAAGLPAVSPGSGQPI